MLTIKIDTRALRGHLFNPEDNTLFPELHMGRNFIPKFADTLAQASLDGKDITVTTSSELLQLRLRLRVAEGLLPHDQVVFDLSVYGDDTLVTLDEEGELSHWRDGLFSEDYEEVRKIRRAQSKKKPEPEEPNELFKQIGDMLIVKDKE